jgi:hypothetical protein
MDISVQGFVPVRDLSQCWNVDFYGIVMINIKLNRDLIFLSIILE